MKSLLDKMIETKELNGELILHSQAILKNTYDSYLRTVK